MSGSRDDFEFNKENRGLPKRQRIVMSYEEATGIRTNNVKEPSALIKKPDRKNENKIAKMIKFVRNVTRKPASSKERSMTDTSRRSIEKIKDDLSKISKYIEEAKEKLQGRLDGIKKKLLELGRKISRLTKEINRCQRRVELSRKELSVCEKELKEVKDQINQPDRAETVLKELQRREKEILERMNRLNIKIKEEMARKKNLENEKKPLVIEKDLLQDKASEIKKMLSTLKDKTKSIDEKIAPDLNIKRRQKPLFDILRESIRENSIRRELEPTQVSSGNFSFRATYDPKNFNMEFQRLKRIETQKAQGSRWVRQMLEKAESHGLYTDLPTGRNNREHGGKDDPGR